MKQMKVDQLALDPLTNLPILILKDARGEQAVPIWIAAEDAEAIARELEKDRAPHPRPFAHDVMKRIILSLDAKVERIDVIDVVDNMFYAQITIKNVDGRRRKIDARPSDAIALALRTGAPIRVAQKVIDQVTRIDFRAQGVLETLRDEDFGKWKM